MTPGAGFTESTPDFYTLFLFGIFKPENSAPENKPGIEAPKMSAEYKARFSEPDPGSRKARPKNRPGK